MLLLEIISIHFLLCQEFLLHFKPKFGSEVLELNKPYVLGSDTLTFHHIKFYITNVSLQDSNQKPLNDTINSYLIDLEIRKTIHIKIQESQSIRQLKFSFGTDSLTNEDGAKGGDLDPMHGMYWTWQTGYINLKCDGIISNETKRNHSMNFHIGGYKFPYNSIQYLSFPVNNKKFAEIEIDFKQIIEANVREQNYTVMSPGKKSQRMAHSIKKSIQLYQ